MPDADQGVVGGMINTSRQIGAAIGAAALLPAVAVGIGHGTGVTGDRAAMLAGVIASALATLLAWRASRARDPVAERGSPGLRPRVAEPDSAERNWPRSPARAVAARSADDGTAAGTGTQEAMPRRGTSRPSPASSGPASTLSLPDRAKCLQYRLCALIHIVAYSTLRNPEFAARSLLAIPVLRVIPSASWRPVHANTSSRTPVRYCPTGSR